MLGAKGVVDAAIVYGARRFFDSVHSDKGWQYRGRYEEEDDALLYYELLHYVFAYEQIILDNSSVTEIGSEIKEFIDRLNHGIGDEWLTVKDIGSYSVGYPITFLQTGICELIARLLRNGILKESTLAEVTVPWAYRRESHHDYDAFRSRTDRLDVDPKWIPFILFLWRGIIYGAFANSEARNSPYAYLAAPGRLSAMRAVLSRSVVMRAEYPRQELVKLVSDLRGLSTGGYDFSIFDSLPPYARSPLTAELYRMPKRDALAFVCSSRNDPKMLRLREEWQVRLFSSSASCAVGATYKQSAENIEAGGNFTQIQIIHAMPYD